MDNTLVIGADTEDAPDVTTQGATVAEPADGVVKNPDGSVTVPLLYPVGELNSVTLHRIKGRGMVDIMNATGEGSRVAQIILTSAGLTGPNGANFLKELDADDFLTLSKVASGFLASGLKNGRSSSPPSPGS